jgi:hypothetical protein
MSDEAQPSGSRTSSPDIVQLRRRVSLIDDRVFLLLEIPTQTPFSVDVMFDRLLELAAGMDRFAYVVDISGVNRPDARTRERLKERIIGVRPRLVHVSLVIGSNAVMRAVAKLVTFASGFRSFSFHASIDDAREACLRALR